MPAIPQDIPLWAIKALALVLGLGLVGLVGLVISRLFRRLTRRAHLD